MFTNDYITLSLLIGLGFIALLELIIIFLLKRKLSFFKKQGGSKNLEQLLVTYGKEIADIRKELEEQAEKDRDLDARITKRVGFVKMSRYDALPEAGGKQSFSMLFLNEENDGFLFSSLNVRGQVQNYAKEIRGGKSERTLSKEEEALLS